MALRVLDHNNVHLVLLTGSKQVRPHRCFAWTAFTAWCFALLITALSTVQAQVYPRVRLPAVPPSTPDPTTARTISQRSRAGAGKRVRIRICSEDFGNAAAFAMAAGAVHSAPALGAMHNTPCTRTCLEDEARCLDEPQKAGPSTATAISRRVEDYAKMFCLRSEAQRK